MPGPEQRRMEKEARRQAALSHLRSVHKLREKQEVRSLSPQKAANVSRDNTSAAAGSRVSPSVVSTTNHTTRTIKTTKESKMPIYKYDSPSSASLKRKAKDNDDGPELEQGDRPVPGHQTKKAKPTSGYVPGTGKPYKGTARDDPKRAASGLVGVLGNKSTNALLKSRDRLAKQDTKNLNRNAPKPKVLFGAGTSRTTQGRPTQSSPKVEEPKAMDGTYTNGLQQAKRDAPKVAKLGTMESVKNGPLRGLKRKAGRDFESEAKKPRIGPSTAPPVRELKVDVKAVPQARTSSFFVQNQKPGHTAAIPANVRHVQEVVKEPTPKLPRTPSKTGESPTAKQAESGALGKKRQREDEAESERPKKAKLSGPESSGWKAPSIEEEPKELAAGLDNHDNACFANAGLQGLFGVPELVAHYEACGDKIPDEVQNVLKGCPGLMRPGKATRETRKERKDLRSAIGDNCFVGTYFSELAKAFKKAAGTDSVSPYVFLEACGTHFKDVQGDPLNGETAQDAAQFINELLKRLHDEEIMERTEIADAQEPSVVQKLFHVQEGKKLVCKKCAHVRDIPNQPIADCYGLNVVLPTSEEPTTLGELLNHARASELLEDHLCPNCKTMDTTTQDVYFKKLPKYLIVRAPRARHMMDERYRPITQKIHTLVKFPAEALDLSFLLSGDETSEVHQYEVFNFVEHKGESVNNGHYVANRKIQGQWYNISDAKIEEIRAEELPKHEQVSDLRTGALDSSPHVRVTFPQSTINNVQLQATRTPSLLRRNHDSPLMDTILQGLNTSQQDAVTSTSDVLQILAPPGSGKTKTLTSRVAYLLQHHQYKPWDIICLTFTVKSSREMKERIANLLGSDTARRLILGTFHSVCRRYLVTYGHLIGVHKGFGIADSSDSAAIIRRVIKRLGLNIDAKKAQSRISSSKSKGLEGSDQHSEKTKGRLAQPLQQKQVVEQQEFYTVLEAYQSHLAQSNLLDYDDLLLRCVDLLRHHPTCVSNVEVVLIDEFQDTNVVQFDLMRLFAAKNKRVTTVGDPDQSIYGWRSAEIKNLERMQHQYPGVLTIHLKDNYRSSGAILLAADEVIQQDVSRPSKPLLPTHCPGTMPVLRRLPSAEAEASWVVSEIQRTVGLTGGLLAYSDFAILLRSASLSRQVESAMGRAGIPYRMVGGKKFFDRLEVKILLDYLRVVSQPSNNDAVSRIMNIPPRGLGASTVKGLLEEAETRKVALWTLLRNSTQYATRTKLSKAAEQGLGSFVNLILTSRNRILDVVNTDSPEAILRYIIEKVYFQRYLEKSHADDHEARWANVEELIAQISEYTVSGTNERREDDDLPNIEGLEQQQGNAAEEALAKFLANVALASELQKEEEDTEGNGALQSQVTISTIHAAKGLEWPVVFVPSAYEGCIPHSRAEDTDEERRLLYVAMTRAQAMLYISCPTKSSQREETSLSPFLSPKPVGNLLVSQGPTINSSTVNDIARILRRGTPTQAQISEASDTLQSVHDNLWPLDGEEVKAHGAKWSKWDSNESSEHPSKRRRVQDSDRGASNGMRACVNTGYVGSTTTMQSSSTFSYNTSFISAAAQLDHVDEHNRTTTRPSGTDKSSHACSEGAGLKRKSSLEQGRGQSNLTSFWGMKAGRESGNAAFEILAEERWGNPVARHKSPNEAFSGLTAITNQGSIGGSCSKRSTLHFPIPETLANHRLQPLSNTNRPRPLVHETESLENKPYVFLSSSPPHIEELVEGVENRGKDQSGPQRTNRVEQPHIEHRDTHILPSRTFHTTSIAQLQSDGAPRKTLGVRRSMNGWSARGSHSFSVPKMNGLKR